MEDPIEGKVVATDDNKFVINRGEKDGVDEGMTFAIFTIGEEITNSLTGERLGNFENIKAKVKVIYVQGKCVQPYECQKIQSSMI